MRRIITLCFLAAFLLPASSFAQRYLGIATSNWSGTNSLYLNPANIADSRTKFEIDLFSLNMGAELNATAKFDFGNLTKSDAKLGDIVQFQTSKSAFSMILPSAEVRGPGFMVALGHKHSIALTTRARVVNQFHNFSKDLYNTIEDTINTSGGNTLQLDKFNWTAHAWSEIGLSYAGIIYEKKKHMVKGGITGRYLMGAGFLSVTSKHIDGTYSFSGGDASMVIKNSDFHYATNGLLGGKDIGIGDIFGKGAGHGFGFDLGAVYEFRPKYEKYQYEMDCKQIMDDSKNKYMLRVSAAITDIGSIKYTGADNRTINGSGSTTSPILGSEIGSKFKDYDSLKTYLGTKGIKVDSGSGKEVKVHLPTALVLGVDWHAIKGLYVNLTYIGNMADRTVVGNSIYSQVSVTPRFDSRIFSFGIPITYSTLSSKFRFGAGLRLGGFFVGSDDLSIIGDKKNGANVYFGANIKINRKKIRDSDHDGVSNKKDKCKGEKGDCEHMGCPNPDKDGDGIVDKEDKCPDVAGSKTAMGCPDADLDSVADAEDRCPQQAGPMALQGCPDRDHDGIVDIDDACPDQPGPAQFKGCPDTDGDGLADNEDECPQQAGPIANHGCPDTDNDGIPDNKDKCPTVPGTITNQGCPEISISVKKRLAFAATAIQFETGKATIKKASYKLLDGIVKILNDYPDYNMSIEGHTDNVGKPDKNMQLSKDRAASVKNYFVSKGISADRLTTNGFGDTKPVASNKTAAGRAKNRRVAMDLKLKD
jgi:outer membrane protein OmpA-like peptidoglycan-associated protein